MAHLGTRITEQMTRLGFPVERLGQELAELSKTLPPALLEQLSVGYGQAALAKNRFSKDLEDARVNLPKAFFNPSPADLPKLRRLAVAPSYTALAGSQPELDPNLELDALLKAGSGAVRMMRALEQDAVLREAFEKKAGFAVQLDGRRDGRLSAASAGSKSFTPKSTPASASVTKSHAMTAAPGRPAIEEALMAMDAMITQEARRVGAHQQAAGGQAGQGGAGIDPDLAGLPFYGTAGQLDPVFAPGGLGGGEVGATGATAAAGDGSVDIRMMRLKRMMDKRNQMYDAVRAIFDKWNEATKNAINNMRA